MSEIPIAASEVARHLFVEEYWCANDEAWGMFGWGMFVNKAHLKTANVDQNNKKA